MHSNKQIIELLEHIAEELEHICTAVGGNPESEGEGDGRHGSDGNDRKEQVNG